MRCLPAQRLVSVSVLCQLYSGRYLQHVVTTMHVAFTLYGLDISYRKKSIGETEEMVTEEDA